MWNFNGAVTIDCPLCRLPIMHLYGNFRLEADEDRDQQHKLDRYNSMHGGARSFSQVLFDAPYLLKRLVTSSVRSGSMVMYLKFMLFIAVGISYILSPFDLLSESVFGLIGVCDDIVFILSILIYISMAYYGVLNNEARAGAA
jgi:RING finger protein 170